MNMKLKWGSAARLRRGAVVLGAVGLAASAGLLATAGSALAAVGTVPGGLQLIQLGVTLPNTGSGPLTTTTTWNSTAACPSGFQTSADIREYSVGGTPTLISHISPVTGVGLSGANFTGSLLGTPGALLNSAGINATSPGTVEWVIACYSGASATGSVSFIGDTFISVASGATSFTLSPTGPVVKTTTTTLGATPNPVALNATATLTATEVASDSTHPAGSVQFENCPTPTTCTNINTPVAVDASGVATTTTSFATAGSVNLAAVFTPTDTVNFSGSTSNTFSLSVGSLAAGGNNPTPITVTVPSTGTLSVTVATSPASVVLTPATPATTPDDTATGTFNTVTIADSRNTFPGWSVSGQESAFTQTPAANTIPANSLGWTPAAVGTLGTGVTLGGTVAPVGANTGSTGPGLGSAAVLVQAHTPNGFGTNMVSAALLLDIPSNTPPGAYAGTLTITYVSAN